MVSLSREGQGNLLFTPKDPLNTSGWQNWGGDFLWVAPQECWGWPPISEFDQLMWDEIADEDGVHVVSPTWNGIVLARQFDFEDLDTLKVVNTIRNIGDTTQEWGLWNISQIPTTYRRVDCELSSEPKVFPYPERVSWDQLKSEAYVVVAEQSTGIHLELMGKTGQDYKIGGVGVEPIVTITTDNMRLEKRWELPKGEVVYPHGCSVEFYQCTEYLEVEIVWPLVNLEPGEEYTAVQFFTVAER
mgnify:CR=1 FL=1